MTDAITSHPDYTEGYEYALTQAYGRLRGTVLERGPEPADWTKEFRAGVEAGWDFCKKMGQAGFKQVAEGEWTLDLTTR